MEKGYKRKPNELSKLSLSRNEGGLLLKMKNRDTEGQ
jgi:hypothetical protein